MESGHTARECSLREKTGRVWRTSCAGFLPLFAFHEELCRVLSSPSNKNVATRDVSARGSLLETQHPRFILGTGHVDTRVYHIPKFQESRCSAEPTLFYR